MTTGFFRCLRTGVLVAGLITPQAMAGDLGMTFIDFQTDAGLLTDQTPSGILTGADSNDTANKGVFSGTGSAFLFSGTRVQCLDTERAIAYQRAYQHMAACDGAKLVKWFCN